MVQWQNLAKNDKDVSFNYTHIKLKTYLERVLYLGFLDQIYTSA